MNPTILAIAEELEKIQGASPFLRIGQIISNASHPIDVFYVTDEELLKVLRATADDDEPSVSSSEK